jgi:hypothetical protein
MVLGPYLQRRDMGGAPYRGLLRVLLRRAAEPRRVKLVGAERQSLGGAVPRGRFPGRDSFDQPAVASVWDPAACCIQAFGPPIGHSETARCFLQEMEVTLHPVHYRAIVHARLS